LRIKTDNFEIIAKTFQGLEDVLEKEARAIGINYVEKRNRAIHFKGNNETLYKSNLQLRTAIKVLKPILKFKAKNEFKLYGEVQKFDWSSIMSYRDSLFVDSTVNSTYFTHSKYVIHKVKDAIVDQFRKKTGKRPDIEMDNPTIRINVHIFNENCTISLDSSGTPLNQRGYRVEQIEAPINEVLAAGLILLSGWKKDGIFVDPMCGSGTLPIEAAMIANNIAPNIKRQHFDFMNWKDFDKALWLRILSEAQSVEKTFSHKIYGFDIAPRAIRIAKKNQIEASLLGKVTFDVRDFEELTPPLEAHKGMIIINPPYGERIEKRDINSFYEMIGNRFKQHFVGYEACIISSNIDALKSIGLKTSFRIALNNGGLKSKYHKYVIYAGSKDDDDF